ncbi:MAG: hypothetical protein GY846_19710, partial [Deltaproteobacteria bacterium]|nr:hypothetical protein [Deltaproteobacteria bacterium]
LMFRKLVANKGVNFAELMKRIDQTIQIAYSTDELKPYGDAVKAAKDSLEDVVEYLLKQAQSGDNLTLYAKACPFLEAMGDVILGWLHLWQLTIAHPRLQAPGSKKKDSAFYYGKVAGAQFFIDTLLRRTTGKIEELKSDAGPVINIFDKSFSG